MACPKGTKKSAEEPRRGRSLLPEPAKGPKMSEEPWLWPEILPLKQQCHRLMAKIGRMMIWWYDDTSLALRVPYPSTNPIASPSHIWTSMTKPWEGESSTASGLDLGPGWTRLDHSDRRIPQAHCVVHYCSLHSFHAAKKTLEKWSLEIWYQESWDADLISSYLISSHLSLSLSLSICLLQVKWIWSKRRNGMKRH